MKTHSTLLKSALVAFTVLVGLTARADNMASIAITPATGTVTLTPNWAIGPNLAGFHLMAQDLSLGGGANQFYSIKNTAIPNGGDIAAFTRYIAASGAATNHADIGSKLTPNSYSALTSADPDLGYGPVQFYFIHHKIDGDYFAHIVPSSGTASSVADLKPMSQPGGPATGGLSGYYGLTFSAADLGYGANIFYYLRTNAADGHAKFGTLIPALAGASADQGDLGTGNGYNALAFTGTDVGYGINKMYYLRLDSVTGFTILGTLTPTSGNVTTADIANLGSVYSTLTFVPGDVGFGTGQFYTTGPVNPTWQSVSFAAIANHAISAGSFTVKPTASSTLPVTLTVVPGSVGAASISTPVAGVYTITPTAPGLITLQATQAGSVTPAYEYNMLRQSFTITGTATLQITTQPTSQSAVTASTATFSVAASGTTTVSYQWRKAGAAISGNASATTATLSLTNAQASDAATYDVVVTNASGSISSNPVTLTVTSAAPVITNSPLSVGGTVGTALSFTITASGSPTSFSASPLPAGLSVVAGTGVISGTPTTAGMTSVLLSATNGSGTGTATLTITIAAAGVAPVINNNPLTAGGTVGSAFTFGITASGSPTSYTATPLPAGLSVAAGSGIISGTPTTVGTTSVLLGATNASGTGNATLTITVGASGTAPVITNSPLTAAGTLSMPFSFTITATGSPTSYSASPLPAGLSLSPTTGVIAGTPTTAGSTAVVLGATNAFGTGNITVTITVAAPAVAPTITNNTPAAAATVGTPFSFTITAAGSATTYTASPLPAGLSIVASTGVITGTPTSSGTTVVTLGASNGTGTGNAILTITIAPATVAPVITSSTTASATTGSPFVTYVIAATGTPTSYNATGLPPGLTISPLTGAITGTPTVAGTYWVTLTATNSAGTSTITLTITIAAAPYSRIVNFSARALSGPGSQTLIMGFVVQGNGKTLLVRGIGPALATYGVTNFLADPMLTLYGANSVVAVNDDWQTPLAQPAGSPSAADGPTLAAAAAVVGGFALPNGSKDAALIYTFNDGAHTTSMVRPNSTTGVALTEIYDIDTVIGPRLINVSARMNVTAGEGTLIAGLVIAGNIPKTVLIRGVGPTLAAFGVTGVLADPTISLYQGSTLVATDDNWETGSSTSAQIVAASAQVGAFALVAGSKDAALLVTLQPGAYSVQVTGVGATSGVALVEVYDTQ
jgi:PKD repeat protein